MEGGGGMGWGADAGHRIRITVVPNGRSVSEGKEVWVDVGFGAWPSVLAEGTRALRLPGPAQVAFNGDGERVTDVLELDDGDVVFLDTNPTAVFTRPRRSTTHRTVSNPGPTPDPAAGMGRTSRARSGSGARPGGGVGGVVEGGRRDGTAGGGRDEGMEGVDGAVGPYRIGRVLGEGGFGSVRLGVHAITKSKVALKFLPKSALVGGGGGEADRLWTEIACLCDLAHPHIMRLHAVINAPHHFVLALEYAEGGDLREWIRRQPGGRLPEWAAWVVFKQLVSAVQYAHARSIVHRDIKLENVLLASKEVRLWADDAPALSPLPARNISISSDTPTWLGGVPPSMVGGGGGGRTSMSTRTSSIGAASISTTTALAWPADRFSGDGGSSGGGGGMGDLDEDGTDAWLDGVHPPNHGIHVYLTDFGLSHYATPSEKVAVTGGSLYYTAPEVIRGRPSSGEGADVYALGVLLYALLVGKTPFRSATLDREEAALKAAAAASHKAPPVAGATNGGPRGEVHALTPLAMGGGETSHPTAPVAEGVGTGQPVLSPHLTGQSSGGGGGVSRGSFGAVMPQRTPTLPIRTPSSSSSSSSFPPPVAPVSPNVGSTTNHTPGIAQLPLLLSPSARSLSGFTSPRLPITASPQSPASMGMGHRHAVAPSRDDGLSDMDAGFSTPLARAASSPHLWGGGGLTVTSRPTTTNTPGARRMSPNRAALGATLHGSGSAASLLRSPRIAPVSVEVGTGGEGDDLAATSGKGSESPAPTTVADMLAATPGWSRRPHTRGSSLPWVAGHAPTPTMPTLRHTTSWKSLLPAVTTGAVTPPPVVADMASGRPSSSQPGGMGVLGTLQRAGSQVHLGSHPAADSVLSARTRLASAGSAQGDDYEGERERRGSDSGASTCRSGSGMGVEGGHMGVGSSSRGGNRESCTTHTALSSSPPTSPPDADEGGGSGGGGAGLDGSRPPPPPPPPMMTTDTTVPPAPPARHGHAPLDSAKGGAVVKGSTERVSPMKPPLPTPLSPSKSVTAAEVATSWRGPGDAVDDTDYEREAEKRVRLSQVVREVRHAIVAGEWRLPVEVSEGLTSPAAVLGLLQGMLNPDPSARMTLAQVADHRWLSRRPPVRSVSPDSASGRCGQPALPLPTPTDTTHHGLNAGHARSPDVTCLEERWVTPGVTAGVACDKDEGVGGGIVAVTARSEDGTTTDVAGDNGSNAAGQVDSTMPLRGVTLPRGKSMTAGGLPSTVEAEMVTIRVPHPAKLVLSPLATSSHASSCGGAAGAEMGPCPTARSAVAPLVSGIAASAMPTHVHLNADINGGAGGLGSPGSVGALHQPPAPPSRQRSRTSEWLGNSIGVGSGSGLASPRPTPASPLSLLTPRGGAGAMPVPSSGRTSLPMQLLSLGPTSVVTPSHQTLIPTLKPGDKVAGSNLAGPALPRRTTRAHSDGAGICDGLAPPPPPTTHSKLGLGADVAGVLPSPTAGTPHRTEARAGTGQGSA